MFDREKAKKAILLFAVLSIFCLFSASLVFSYFFWLDQNNRFIDSKFANAQFLATFTFVFMLIVGLFVVVTNFMSSYLQDYDVRIFKGKKLVSRSRMVDESAHEFVSMASHQMRSPLIAIKWMCQEVLNRNGKMNKEELKLMNTIRDLADRVIKLVDALLNVSRLEAGAYKFVLEKFDIADVIGDVTKEFEMRFKERGITLEKDMQRKSMDLISDRKSLDLILENLLSNAIKYSPNGSKIRISANMLKKGQRIDGYQTRRESCIISVTDRGFGIPFHQQDLVFSKLFRADNAKIHSTEGTGLGLYCIKRIVDALDGDIWFKSKENEGSSFFVTIPLKLKNA